MSLLVSRPTADRITRKLLEAPQPGRRRKGRGSLDEHQTWIKITNVTSTLVEGITCVRLGNATWNEYQECIVDSVNGGLPAVGKRYRGYQTGNDEATGKPKYTIDHGTSTTFFKLNLGFSPGLPDLFGAANYGISVPARTIWSGLAWITFTLPAVAAFSQYYAIAEWMPSANPPSDPGAIGLIVGQFAISTPSTNQTTIPISFWAYNTLSTPYTLRFGIRQGGYGFELATNQVVLSFNSFST